MMKLDKFQQKAYDTAIIENSDVIFITGDGGCGKSTILKLIQKHYKAKGIDIHTLAPTVSASDLIGGVTLASFFKQNPIMDLDAEDESDVIKFDNFADMDNLSNKSVLIIDEVSMLGKSKLKHIISKLDIAKLILFGDLGQLPPVKDGFVDWAEYADEVCELPINYRQNNKELKSVVDRYKEDAELPKSLFVDYKKSVVKQLFDDGYTFIAFKNDTLSKLENICQNTELHREVLSFGQCDRKIVIKNTKQVYISNNTRLMITNTAHIDKLTRLTQGYDLTACYVKRADGKEYESTNQFLPHPVILTGKISDYNDLLEVLFDNLKSIQNKLSKKYKLRANDLIKNKNKFTHEESKQLSLAWANYLGIKNTPYARDSRFITTYKSQGRGIDKVAIFIDELPSKKHITVALGRATDDIKILSKDITDFDTY